MTLLIFIDFASFHFEVGVRSGSEWEGALLLGPDVVALGRTPALVSSQLKIGSQSPAVTNHYDANATEWNHRCPEISPC